MGSFPKYIRRLAGRIRGWRCEKCGRRFDEGWMIECHHIIPSSEGGPDTLNNLQLLCTSCHYSRHVWLAKHGIGDLRSPSLVKYRLKRTRGGRPRKWLLSHNP